MPKLDLSSAARIKGAGGEIAALKGAGFLWVAPTPADALTLDDGTLVTDDIGNLIRVKA